MIWQNSAGSGLGPRRNLALRSDKETTKGRFGKLPAINAGQITLDFMIDCAGEPIRDLAFCGDVGTDCTLFNVAGEVLWKGIGAVRSESSVGKADEEH
jgi:hypothetical protein